MITSRFLKSFVILAAATFLSCCTLQKRIYTGGYYVSMAGRHSTAPSAHGGSRIEISTGNAFCQQETSRESVLPGAQFFSAPFFPAPVIKKPFPVIQKFKGAPGTFSRPAILPLKVPGPDSTSPASRDARRAMTFLILTILLGITGLVLAMVFAKRSMNENLGQPELDQEAWKKANTVWNIGRGFFLFVLAAIGIVAYIQGYI